MYYFTHIEKTREEVSLVYLYKITQIIVIFLQIVYYLGIVHLTT